MTTAQTNFPRRFRLHGGRNTHAGRPINGDPTRLVTACDCYADPNANHPLPDDAVITCPACVRAINRTT